MKKVSVIVPVYNTEAYLDACLSSLMAQTLQEIEVLVVNDGSTDGSQEIIDRYVVQHPDKIHGFTIPNGGAAAARNAALPHVTGEYVGFVDSDDTVRPDMYEKMYQKAKAMQADIVCCDYMRVAEGEKVTCHTFANGRISEETLFDKSVYEAPLLFQEVPYACTKLFKTALIRDHQIAFRTDLRIYEDLLFTYSCFAHADRISRVDEPFYDYVVSRSGSLTNELSEKRFDLTKVTDYLMDYYKELGRYEELKEALWDIVIRHMYVVLLKEVRKEDKALKLRYLDTMFSFLDRTYPQWKSNMYFRGRPKFYKNKAYWKLVIHVPALRTWGKRFIHTGAFVARQRAGFWFRKAQKGSLQDRAVMLFPAQGKNIQGNLFYVLKELASNPAYSSYSIYIGYEKGCKGSIVALLKQYGLEERVILTEKRSRMFAKQMACCKYLFSDASLPYFWWKREGQMYCNTWHGTPLKTLGKATEDSFFDIANVQKNFILADYLLYPSRYMKETMVRDYMLDGISQAKVLYTGYPRNEILVQNRADAKQKFGVKGYRVIAYMPTWRGNERTVGGAEQIKQIQEYLRVLSAGLHEDERLYINLHPFVGKQIDVTQYRNVCTFPAAETYDFLSVCDALITDYSSVMFDFALTRKPIYLFTYDEADYLRNRGMYLSLDELPFPRAYDAERLLELLHDTDRVWDYEAFLQRFCPYDSADASHRLCETVLLHAENGMKKEPITSIDRKRVLVYGGNFAPTSETWKMIDVINQTHSDSYDYYVSYVTDEVASNKEVFHHLEDHVRFFGQFGRYGNCNRRSRFLTLLLKHNKNWYRYFRNWADRIHSLEMKRVYGNVTFDSVILYGKIATEKVYELSCLKGTKILYINHWDELNQMVYPDVYRRFDWIMTPDEKTLSKLKAYGKDAQHVILTKDITSLVELESYYHH